MHRKKRTSLLIVLITAGAALSCNLPSVYLSQESVETISARTVEASRAEDGSGTGPLPVAEATMTPTTTALPSLTPTFTPSLTATPTPVPCNWAQYVTDVNWPDYSVVPPDWVIDKTWRIRNIGTCTWTSGYKFIFSHGDRWDAPDEVPVTAGAVAPGATVDITVTLRTSDTDGTYQGYFKMREPGGETFRIEEHSSGTVWWLLEVAHQADFEAHFDNVHLCGVSYSTILRIGNTGNTGLDSAFIKLTNKATTAQIGSSVTSNAPFLPTAGSCLPGTDGPIGPGSVWYLLINAYPTLIEPPSGLEVRAYITLCSGENLTGECKEKTVDFTYP